MCTHYSSKNPENIPAENKSRVNNFVFTSTGFTYRHGDRPDEVKLCPDMIIKCKGELVSAFTAKRETAKTFFEKLSYTINNKKAAVLVWIFEVKHVILITKIEVKR
jgi:hypothetical protein